MDLLELPLTTEAAIAVLRIGMRQEAHLRKDWWSTGEWADTLIYGMLSSDRQTAGLSAVFLTRLSEISDSFSRDPFSAAVSV